MTRRGWAESILLLLPLRLALAAIFALAAGLKLDDPQAFAFAIKAFNLLEASRYDHALIALAFGLPWAEMLCAVCLLLGIWTRPAAALLSVMLIAFTAALLSLIARGIETDCACFGDKDLFCEGGVGWCHIARNAGFLAASLLLVWRGGGRLALEARRHSDRPVLDEASSER